MRIKKLRIKRFGELVDREYDGGHSLVTIEAVMREEQRALSEFFMVVLFGFPPHRRARQEEYIPELRGTV